jgi:glycosyltransferase involved in cell wall biosynthesis
MKVLTVTTLYRGGGAEGVARDLARGLADRGIESHIRVRAGEVVCDPGVSAIPFDKHALSLPRKAVYYAKRLVQEAGVESWASPALRHVLDDLPFQPDIVHLHNIHGGYVRLEDLEWLCERVPVVWTLHDMWAVTGHCAYSFECERWRVTCGRCPHMDIYPRIRLDFSRLNRWRRARLYSRIVRRLPGRLHLVCPSRWLADIARQGVARELPVHWIPYGIALDAFTPGTVEERSFQRSRWGVPDDAFVILFAANRGRTNPFKDYQAFADAAIRLRTPAGERMAFVMAGDAATQGQRDGTTGILSIGLLATKEEMASAYRAADVYVQATKADNLPLSVLEAMACALPVVGTRVGGVPDMVEDGVTGFLVSPTDGGSLAAALERLADNPALCSQYALAARQHVLERYRLEQMVTACATLYSDILARKIPS